MNGHIDESAELYALGILDQTEIAALEHHASSCPACAQRLREAEATVTAIGELEPQQRAPRALATRLERSLSDRPTRAGWNWQALLAGVAAAFILAVAPFGYVLNQNRSMHAVMSNDNRALARLAGGQFNHASFEPRTQGAPPAKVLYARNGSWYYVIVRNPRPDMQVAYKHDGTMEMLGRVAMRGDMGTLYLPVDHKMDELALVERGAVIADAHLAY
ncbi:MAG: hypothetical protein ACXVAO_14070 [Vulcanimicrobiaceae bacterium]